MTKKILVSWFVVMLSAGLTLLALSGCDPAAKLLGAGPFSGQVIDSDTGLPIRDAFVGFIWGGGDWIEGHHNHLLAVLVQTNADGRYQVPWQGDKLPMVGVHSIRWSEEVWAPGYKLLEMGENETKRNVNRSGVDAKLQLSRTTSVLEGLEEKNRMRPSDYTNFDRKYERFNFAIQRDLALSLYQDSYRRVCEGALTDDALNRRAVEVPRGDASTYGAFNITAPVATSQTTADRESWQLLYRKAGWMDQSRLVNDPPALDRALLPELCRLSRLSPGSTGNLPSQTTGKTAGTPIDKLVNGVIVNGVRFICSHCV